MPSHLVQPGPERSVTLYYVSCWFARCPHYCTLCGYVLTYSTYWMTASTCPWYLLLLWCRCSRIPSTHCIHPGAGNQVDGWMDWLVWTECSVQTTWCPALLRSLWPRNGLLLLLLPLPFSSSYYYYCVCVRGCSQSSRALYFYTRLPIRVARSRAFAYYSIYKSTLE